MHKAIILIRTIYGAINFHAQRYLHLKFSNNFLIKQSLFKSYMIPNKRGRIFYRSIIQDSENICLDSV